MATGPLKSWRGLEKAETGWEKHFECGTLPSLVPRVSGVTVSRHAETAGCGSRYQTWLRSEMGMSLAARAFQKLFLSFGRSLQ